MTQLYYNQYSNCILVKGAKRAVVCDLQLKRYKFIPNDLYNILEENKGKTIAEIKSQFDTSSNKIIEEYISFLIENDFGFLSTTKQLSLFPEIDLHWDEPSFITNCILDINHHSKYNIYDIIDQLELLECKYIQIRSYSNFGLCFYENILKFLEAKKFVSVDLFMKYNDDLALCALQDLINKYPRVSNIFIHTSPWVSFYGTNNLQRGNITYTNQPLSSEKHCGIISHLYFNADIKLFSESQNHNTCLNRKISVDVKGNIKNCPSMEKSYGNVENTTLQQAIDKVAFKKIWNICKDKIAVCKDCEFRHICTDCRAYIENPNDIFSKPLKCGYNPYTAEWEDWSNNPLKKKAIKHYQMG